MNLKQILPLGFGAIFALIGISTVASQVSTTMLADAKELVTLTYQIEGTLNRLEKNFVDAETGQRGFLLTQNPAFLAPYNQALLTINNHFQTLEDLFADTPEQQERLSRLKVISDRKLAELAQTINLQQNGQRERVLAIVESGEGKQYMDEMRDILNEMLAVEARFLEERQGRANVVQSLVMVINWGSGLLAIAVGLVAIIAIDRIAVKPINAVTNTLASSSTQIAAAVEQQERTASAQASAVSQTTATMDELSASCRQSSEHATIAATAAQKTLQLADKGTQEVQESLQGIVSLKDKVNNIGEQIEQLKAQTQQIGTISQLVSELANQTNMLALNAAVEAVRAGEYGKGFSVVAAEIRKLADQSHQSAQSINTLVTDIQNAIATTALATTEGNNTADLGLDLAQHTVQTFANVAAAVNTMATNNQQISLNLKQQLDAIQQVVQAMSNINQAARETAQGIGQTKISTENLNLAAMNLKSVV
jgi:methyl-accepting chemotaxis protein